MLRNLRPFFTFSMIWLLRRRNTSCEMVGEETAVRVSSTPSGASFLRFLIWSSARERSDGVEVPWTPAVTKESRNGVALRFLGTVRCCHRLTVEETVAGLVVVHATKG